jgi:hypothetical protein
MAMKKWILLAILVPGIYLCAFTQEKKMSAGMGTEWNMASRHDFAAGTVLNFLYNLPGSTSLGLSFTGSMNFNKIYVLEPAFLVRHYFLQDNHSGFFVQFDAGAFIAFEEKGITPMIKSGLGGGYRLILKKLFYIEPYGRLGYPFAFGLGAMAGICF